MKMYVQETHRYVVERAKGTEALSVAELCEAAQYMPNGYRVVALHNRNDGTTVLVVQADHRKPVQVR